MLYLRYLPPSLVNESSKPFYFLTMVSHTALVCQLAASQRPYSLPVSTTGAIGRRRVLDEEPMAATGLIKIDLRLCLAENTTRPTEKYFTEVTVRSGVVPRSARLDSTACYVGHASSNFNFL
jgi:hypothetical protein